MNKFAEHIKKHMGKKATVGYNAKPESLEEEMAIDLAEEIETVADLALEKAGLFWGGYSGEEERKQRVEVAKKAIRPLITNRLKKSIEGPVYDLVIEHLTDTNAHTVVSAIEEIMKEKQATKCASRMDWEFPGWETETIEDKIEWLYTHNKNYNNTQYDNIWKLRETLKDDGFVDYDEKGEKVYLNKEDIEDILYYLKHHNKNYHGDQYWIIDSLKVEDFLGKLKKATKRAKVTKKQASAFKVEKLTNSDFVDLVDYAKDMGDEIWSIIYGKIVHVVAVIIAENKVLYEPLINDKETQEMYANAAKPNSMDFETLDLLPGDDSYADLGFVVKESSSKRAKVTKKADKIQDRQFKEIYLNLIDHKTSLKDYRTLLNNMSYEERMAYRKWLKDNNHAIDEMEMVNFLQTLDNTQGINANKRGKKMNKLADIIRKEINKSAENTGKFGVEYRNMHNAIHGILITDTETKAKAILEYLKELEDETDEAEIEFAWININSLATDTMEEVDYRETEKSNGIYKGIKIINYDEIKPDVYGI